MSLGQKTTEKTILLPPKKLFKNNEIADMLIKARVELGELDGYLSSVLNPTIFSSVFILQSLASSETEEINTTLTNVFRNQLLPKDEQDKESKEVLAYREASILAFRNLRKNKISNQMILEIQSNLLPEGLNGYRKDLKQMDDFEKFINQKNIDIDPLIKSILAHYQLLAIHPFRDGNGRIARIVMNLLLVQEGVLAYPITYMSGYVYKNKNEYYRKLLGVEMNGKWKEYVIFMLKGFYLQAKQTKILLSEIMQSFIKLSEIIKTNNKKIYSTELVEALYTYQIISPLKLAHELGIHYTTASRYLYELSKAGILSEERFGKYHLFTNKKLLSIVKRESDLFLN
ncbi:MAG TPA: Fic family protein [Candidatus Saccharimonadales bacterium]|jgi:Fic family protein|nr:Fic family protein [Candidatus Saccharimonadales bacterium]